MYTGSRKLPNAVREVNRMAVFDFLLIGAMKSYTTAFYQYLQQHLQVCMILCTFEEKRLNFHAPPDPEGPNRVATTSIESCRKLFDGVSEEKAIRKRSIGTCIDLKLLSPSNTIYPTQG